MNDSPLVIGLGELKTSNREEDVLITYSLGSCVGLSLYDPRVKVGGLVHCMNPDSRVDAKKARTQPCLFTDLGVVALLESLFSKGASRRSLVAKVAGAACIHGRSAGVNVGEKNYVVLRKVLWKNNILIAEQDVGGSFARTLSLYIGTGETRVKCDRKVNVL